MRLLTRPAIFGAAALALASTATVQPAAAGGRGDAAAMAAVGAIFGTVAALALADAYQPYDDYYPGYYGHLPPPPPPVYYRYRAPRVVHLPPPPPVYYSRAHAPRVIYVQPPRRQVHIHKHRHHRDWRHYR